MRDQCERKGQEREKKEWKKGGGQRQAREK